MSELQPSELQPDSTPHESAIDTAEPTTIATARERSPLLRDIGNDVEVVNALGILLGDTASLWLQHICQPFFQLPEVMPGHPQYRPCYQGEPIPRSEMFTLCRLLEAAVLMQDTMTEADTVAQLADACRRCILAEGPPLVGPLADAAGLCGRIWNSSWRVTVKLRPGPDAHFEIGHDWGHLQSVPLYMSLALNPQLLVAEERWFCDDSPVSQYIAALGLSSLHPARLAAVFRRLPLFAAVRMPTALMRLCMLARANRLEQACMAQLASGSAGLELSPREGLDGDTLTRIHDQHDACFYRLPRHVPALSSLAIQLPRCVHMWEELKAAQGIGEQGNSSAIDLPGLLAQKVEDEDSAVGYLVNHHAPGLTRLVLGNLRYSLNPLPPLDCHSLRQLRSLELDFDPEVHICTLPSPFARGSWFRRLDAIRATLEELTISDLACPMPEQLGLWLGSLKDLHALRRLRLPRCRVSMHMEAVPDEPGLPVGIQQLSTLTRLEHLDISDRAPAAAWCNLDVLLPQITHFPLTALVLAGTGIMQLPAARCVALLTTIPTLRLLDVGGTICPRSRDLEQEQEQGPLNGWAAFAAQAGRLTQLQHLRMSGVDVSRDAWPQVLAGLRGLRGLETLQAVQCRGLGDGAWPHVLGLLRALPRLESVDLSHNRFSFITDDASMGAADAAAQGEAWPQHAQHVEPVPVQPASDLKLRRIRLVGCNPRVLEGDQSVRAAHMLCAELLTRTPQLEHVDLRGNYFGEGVESVIRGELQETARWLRQLHVLP